MKTLISVVILLNTILMMHLFVPDQTMGIVMADTTYQNPNGTSELAVLMREMQACSNHAKEDIKVGKSPAAYPSGFDKIYTAKISDGMSKSDYYKSFADLYIMAVKNYASSVPAQRIETYNNMVSACLACHSQHCPGPVPVIKKMIIPESK